MARTAPSPRPVRKTNAAPADEGLRARKKARLRQAIIDTTISLVRERGYEATTVEEVVRLIEVSQPTFYNYFSSKEAVLRAVAHDVLALWASAVALEADPAREGTTAEKLRRLYAAQAKWMAADKPLWRAIVISDAMNVYRTPDDEIAAHVALEKHLTAILALGQERGEVTRAIPAARLAFNLIALQIVACAAWGVDKPARRSLARTLDENLDFFLRAAT